MTARIGLSWIAAFALVTGCGTNDASPVAAPSVCEQLNCIANQKVCVGDGKAARCEPCPGGEYAAPSGSCEVIEGTPIAHEFADFTVQPGAEVYGFCQSWTLGNATEIWVNAVALEQDSASHHSNWTFVPADKFDGPDGVWKCSDRGYDQTKAALAGGVLYAQSTQAAREVQKFPDGVAVRIPPYSRIIGDVHLLNPSTSPVTGNVKLTVYGIPEAEVAHKLVPFHMTYTGLAIPPHSKSRFFGECLLTDKFAASGDSFDPRIYYILPHTHSMAKRFFFEVFGGPRDGETILEIGPYDGEAHGRLFSKPFDMTGAEGYRFGCDYNSDRSDTVGWGLGDQEMCELLGFAESNVGFETAVTASQEVGMDGDVRLFTAPCSTIAFAWDHDKPGGPMP